MDAPRRRSRVFPSEPQSVGVARRFVEEAASAVSGVDVEAVVLLASELVSNAVLHGGGDEVAVEVRLGRDQIWVGISDNSPAMETPPPRRETGGLGLPLVGQLSDGWGVDELDRSHKCVWFQMHAAPRF